MSASSPKERRPIFPGNVPFYPWKASLSKSRKQEIVRTLVMVIATVFIRAYQLLISPLVGPACRFSPSCSQYALEAIRRHGALKGSSLAIKRLLRCHPWHAGGFDPVP
jgi:uncharacterized protein